MFVWNSIEGPEHYYKYEFTEAVDLIDASVKGVELPKAKTLILTRGSLPRSLAVRESEFLKEVIIGRGTDSSMILLTKERIIMLRRLMLHLISLHQDRRFCWSLQQYYTPLTVKILVSKNIQLFPVTVDHGLALKNLR